MHHGDGSAANSTDQPATYVRLDKVTYPNGRQIGYNYAAGVDNIMSRLSSISDSVGNLAEYSYLGLSTIAKETRPQVPGGLTLDYDPDGNGTFSGFDRFGRVVNQLWKNTARTVVDGYRYGYDRSGNVTWKQNATPGASGLDELYAYDEVYRLTNTQRGTLGFTDPNDPQITGTPTKTQDWTLDGLGNFAEFDDNGTPQTRTTNAANEIETITGGTVTPEYDAAGNMITGPSSNDASVRLHYVYDAWNRLVAVYADNSGSLGNLIAAYEYDGANRRIEKALPAGSTTDFYYNQQWQLLEERTTAGTTTTTDQYVWDQSYIDAPIVRFHDGNNDGDCSPSAVDDPDDTVRYYTWDANHNVTTTITVDAAATTTIKHNVYDAYGKATVYSSDWSTSLGAPTENGPLYCGYMFDAETGNYLARNRFYSVVLATWISRDPVGYAAGDANLYRYLNGDPLRGTDPAGLMGPVAIGIPNGQKVHHTDPNLDFGNRLAIHWFIGGGKTYENSGLPGEKDSDVLMSQPSIRLAAKNQLEGLRLKLCAQTKDSKTDGFVEQTIYPQPDNWFLIQTTNVPSGGLRMQIHYSVDTTCGCCKTNLNVDYRWLDLADIHPDHHWPDSWMQYIPASGEFWIDIRWGESTSKQSALPGGSCKTKWTGWPYEEKAV